jgi:hypothetical protein
MSDQNVHPNITFRITGYRTISGDSKERLSNGLAGHWQTNHHIFPDGSFEDVKRAYPIGSEHAHVPPPPCRYAMIFAGSRDMLEEQRQLYCRHCYPATTAVDNRKATALWIGHPGSSRSASRRA